MAQRRTPAAADKPAATTKGQTVKVGDRVELKANGIAVLPDGSAVTCRTGYTFEHEGLHVIDGVEYQVEKK